MNTQPMTTKWIILFCDPDPLTGGEGWRERLLYRMLGWLRPGFRHCWAMRRADAFAGWVVVNPTSARLDIFDVCDGEVIECGDRTFTGYDAFLDDSVARGILTHVQATEQPGKHWRPRGLFSCVVAIKHLLGVEAPWVMTPWQLYQYLNPKSTPDQTTGPTTELDTKTQQNMEPQA